MRRLLVIILCLIYITALPGYAREGYWEGHSAEEIACRDNRGGCMVLQMVMMGSFAELDTGDNLQKRVMAAALMPLKQISDADIRHFCEEFGEDEARVRELYFQAVGNCLWADILLNPAEGDEKAARTVMLLFIDPESMLDADGQMEQIRSALDDEVIATIAGAGDVPEYFVRYLLLGEIVIPEVAVETDYDDSPDDYDDDV